MPSKHIAVGMFKVGGERPSEREGTPGTILLIETGGDNQVARLYIKGEKKWFYIDLEEA